MAQAHRGGEPALLDLTISGMASPRSGRFHVWASFYSQAPPASRLVHVEFGSAACVLVLTTRKRERVDARSEFVLWVWHFCVARLCGSLFVCFGLQSGKTLDSHLCVPALWVAQSRSNQIYLFYFIYLQMWMKPPKIRQFCELDGNVDHCGPDDQFVQFSFGMFFFFFLFFFGGYLKMFVSA